MTRLGPDEVAMLVCAHRGELARIWREARAIARAHVFPGLIDGIVEPFLEACGGVLTARGKPEEVWPSLHGVVRSPPTPIGEVHREWALLGEVLAAATDAVPCEKEARAWLKGAVSDCRYGMANVLAGLERCPPGMVVAVLFSPFVPPRIRQERKATDA